MRPVAHWVEKVCTMPEPEPGLEPQPDPYGTPRQVSNKRILRLGQSVKPGVRFEGEDARMVQAMRDDLRYDEVSQEEGCFRRVATRWSRWGRRL